MVRDFVNLSERDATARFVLRETFRVLAFSFHVQSLVTR